MSIRSIQPNLAGYEVQRLEQNSTQRQDASTSKARTDTSDRISISDQGRIQASTLKAAQDSDGVRTEKVADVKARIAAGTYQIDSQDIASKMVRKELDIWG
ncbi:hypothetical protein MASR1M90_01850 [Desulfovibrionales bacterium]